MFRLRKESVNVIHISTTIPNVDLGYEGVWFDVVFLLYTACSFDVVVRNSWQVIRGLLSICVALLLIFIECQRALSVSLFNSLLEPFQLVLSTNHVTVWLKNISDKKYLDKKYLLRLSFEFGSFR